MNTKTNLKHSIANKNNHERLGSLEIAYVLLRFPGLTETFVTEEIKKVQEAGIKVRIYSLLPPRDRFIDPLSMKLVPETKYAPGIHEPSLWWAQFYYLIKAPGQYIKLLWLLLTQPVPKTSFYLKRFVIFLKSVWLAKELKKTTIRLLHTHFAWLSGVAGMVVSQLLDIPFTVTAHAYDIYSQKNDLLQLTTDYADRTITISESNKHTILEMNKNLTAEKIEVVHCGIDLHYFGAESTNFENEVFEITSVGSLIEKKGHEYLIRACAILKTQGVKFHCVIVGGGPLKDKLKDLVRNLNLDGMVEVVGKQTQEWVRKRLKNSDLFVLASVVANDGDRDGIPVAIMEAMAMNVTVISTPVSGIPELVQHKNTGLLVPTRDERVLATIITELIQNAIFRRSLAQHGRRLVETEYDILKNVAQLCSLFRRVIDDRSYKALAENDLYGSAVTE